MSAAQVFATGVILAELAQFRINGLNSLVWRDGPDADWAPLSLADKRMFMQLTDCHDWSIIQSAAVWLATRGKHIS